MWGSVRREKAGRIYEDSSLAWLSPDEESRDGGYGNTGEGDRKQKRENRRETEQGLHAHRQRLLRQI